MGQVGAELAAQATCVRDLGRGREPLGGEQTVDVGFWRLARLAVDEVPARVLRTLRMVMWEMSEALGSPTESLPWMGTGRLRLPPAHWWSRPAPMSCRCKPPDRHGGSRSAEGSANHDRRTGSSSWLMDKSQ